jgi:hypothetical protein
MEENMNHLIEQLVKDYRHHMQALESFGSLAIEVYVAYLLEKAIERFHETIGKFLRIPDALAATKKMRVMLLQSAKKLWGK